MNEKIIFLMLGAVIGGIIGFTSSYFMWKIQMSYKKRNIAHGFYLEISSLEKTIELYAKAFEAPGPGAGLVKIDQPFYNDGLFFALRKEISGFNQDLSKRLFEFYTCLLTADRARQVASSDQFFKQANDEMKNSIKESYNLLPNLKKSLKKEFSLLRWQRHSK